MRPCGGGTGLKSARRFGRLRRRFPAREEGYREGANALAKDGRLDEAEAVIAEGMQRTGNWLMWYTAAELAERADDREEAVRRWDAMRVRFPSVASGFLRGAEALARAGHGEAAAALIRQARDFFPGNKEIAAAADLAAPAAESPPPVLEPTCCARDPDQVAVRCAGPGSMGRAPGEHSRYFAGLKQGMPQPVCCRRR